MVEPSDSGLWLNRVTLGCGVFTRPRGVVRAPGPGGRVSGCAQGWGLDTNVCGGGVLLSHTLASAVPSALAGLASGFGMGPGVSLPL